MNHTPEIVRTIFALRQAVASWRAENHKVAVVPTMGALHEGHLTLVREAAQHAGRVIVTIFVNPKQFAANEDLSRYPRDEESDLAMLDATGANLVFSPDLEEIYADDFATQVLVAGPAKAGLEDKYRPQFFTGVATVVAKLFIQSGADYAMFGEKDYQQLCVVRRMARDLDIPIQVLGVPTVREADGLAMSSRNRYLSKAERHQAAAINKTLAQAATKIKSGGNIALATRAASRSLTTLGFKVDYVTARNAETLAVPREKGEPLRLLAAAWLGSTRLIDNIAV
ncbi:MAG: pantoate--beta-alanine ligase [Aestuariivirga sp.]